MPHKYFEITADSGYYHYPYPKNNKTWHNIKDMKVTGLLVEETFDSYVLEHTHIMQEGDDPNLHGQTVRSEFRKDDPKIKPKNIQTEFFLLRHKHTGRYHRVGSSSAPRLYNTYNKAKANFKDDDNWEVFPVVVGDTVVK